MIRITAIILVLFFSTTIFAEPKCLWVSSYAPGYKWNDGIGEGIHSILDGKCEIKVFHMDTKRNKTISFGKSQALKARALIDSYDPDVIIASDDNASKYLVVPYYKNAIRPIVVCGINSTPDVHGYPFSNVTGMIEIQQILPLLQVVKKILSINSGTVYFVAPDTTTSKIDIEYTKKYFSRAGLSTKIEFVDDFNQWKNAFIIGQQYDAIFLLNNAGINNWNDIEARNFVDKHGKKLSIGIYEWAKYFTMIVYAKSANEQGEWAGKVALEIINGASPSDIPLTTNKNWEKYINVNLLEKAKIKLGRKMIKRAISE